MEDPRTFHIACDKEGFYIEDDYGEEYALIVTPMSRFPSMADAKWALDEMVADYLANYEPPEWGDAWSGGFCGNH